MALVFVTVSFLIFAPVIILEKLPEKKEYHVVVDSAVSLPSIDYGRYGSQTVDTAIFAVSYQPIHKTMDSIAEPKKDKIFLVGYIGADKQNNINYGCAEQFWTFYPELEAAREMIAKKTGLKNVAIVSVCKQTEFEHKLFWNK